MAHTFIPYTSKPLDRLRVAIVEPCLKDAFCQGGMQLPTSQKKNVKYYCWVLNPTITPGNSYVPICVDDILTDGGQLSDSKRERTSHLGLLRDVAPLGPVTWPVRTSGPLLLFLPSQLLEEGNVVATQSTHRRNLSAFPRARLLWDLQLFVVLFCAACSLSVKSSLNQLATYRPGNARAFQNILSEGAHTLSMEDFGIHHPAELGPCPNRVT